MFVFRNFLYLLSNFQLQIKPFFFGHESQTFRCSNDLAFGYCFNCVHSYKKMFQYDICNHSINVA